MVADALAGLQVRRLSVPIMFSETRQRVEDCPSGQPRPQPLPRLPSPPLCAT
jgi:hypothetical protein